MSTELVVFARFDAAPAQESALADAIARVVAATRTESGCLEIRAFRGVRDASRIIIHSRWRDSAAFDEHGLLPHTIEFLERAKTLITHEFDITRTVRIV